MPFAHHLQNSRFELKYLVSEARARAIRNFARSYLEPDEHAVDKADYQYSIFSLYLDSPDLALCRATMAGEKNRFKLRVRFYADDLKSHAFFEIKRRLNDVILKQRVQVRRSSVERLLAGHWPQRGDLVNPARDNLGTLQRFCELRDRIRAKGWAFVCYAREAYVPPDNNTLRVTFDRNLMSWRYREDFGLKRSSSVVHPRVGGVILEVKFTDRFPRWIRQMVRIFGLERTSMPKYVICTKELLKSGSPVLTEYLGSVR